MRNRFAVPGYGDGLSMLDRPKEFGQTCLGLGSWNFTHMQFRPVVLTIPCYPRPLPRSAPTGARQESAQTGQRYGSFRKDSDGPVETPVRGQTVLAGVLVVSLSGAASARPA